MKLKVVIFLLILTGCRIDCSRENTKKKFYRGVIVDMFQEPFNHNADAFRIKVDNNDTIRECAESCPKIWEYAEIGDSAIKPKDTLILIIKKKKNVQKTFHYDF